MSPPDPMSRALRAVAEPAGLPEPLVRDVFRQIMTGEATSAQIGGLLMGMATRGETQAEVRGAAAALREAVVRISCSRSPVLDTCGTGGSGISRRNVSTAVAIVCASLGVAVAKHGNRAASSRSGSADVLEALGVNIDASPETVTRCIDEVGIGFLFARALHPAMKHAAGVRRELGVRTIFNLLGPLVNPASASRQLLGVYDPARLHHVAGALRALGSQRALVVHGFRAGVSAAATAAPGIDDASPEGETLVVELRDGKLHEWVLRPSDAGVGTFSLDELAGGTPAENAAALTDLLGGHPGPYREAVKLSGALSLLAASDADRSELPALARQVEQALDSGAAAQTLQALVACSHGKPAGDAA